MLHLDLLRKDRCRRVAWLILLPLAFCSCGSSDKPEMPLVPIQGKVFYQGQPASGATVILHPLKSNGDSPWKTGYPNGAVAADGRVKIQTAGKWDGAPAGEYAVLVIWIPIVAGDQRTSEEQTVDKLAGKYADPANSPWQVKVEGTGCQMPRIDLR